MENWLRFNKCKMTIKEALLKLNELIDESDPDSDLPNIVHAFQTAEKIRADHPHEDWFHLTGLIHDLGKVIYMLFTTIRYIYFYIYPTFVVKRIQIFLTFQLLEIFV